MKTKAQTQKGHKQHKPDVLQLDVSASSSNSFADYKPGDLRLFHVCLRSVVSGSRPAGFRGRFWRGVSEAHLSPVGEEDGTSQISCDATQDIDDRYSKPSGQLLQVSKNCHLKTYRHQAMQNPVFNRQREHFKHVV